MAEARAFWVTAPGVGELRPEPLPAVRSGTVRVRTLFSAVSRGTEALVFHGRVPKSEWQRMRAPHQAGEFPAPVKYGYASVGRVVEGEASLLGKKVFCLYPHQDEYVVPVRAVVPLPIDVSAERAVLAANIETAINAFWDARPLFGDRITVVGGGVVGALLAYLASRLPETHVELVDVNSDRQRVASAFNVDFAAPANATAERDIVFHASATETGLNTALNLLGDEGTVVELSWYGDQPIAVDLGGAFHVKRLKLCASHVGTVSPHARRRYNNYERLLFALSMCRHAELDILFEQDVAFDELPEAMARILVPGHGALCQRIRYGDS